MQSPSFTYCGLLHLLGFMVSTFYAKNVCGQFNSASIVKNNVLKSRNYLFLNRHDQFFSTTVTYLTKDNRQCATCGVQSPGRSKSLLLCGRKESQDSWFC